MKLAELRQMNGREVSKRDLSDLKKLKSRLGLDLKAMDDDLELKVILEEAEADVLDYCRRDDFVGNMKVRARELAIIRWNRRGTEGESGRSEGQVSQQFEEIPKKIQSQLNQYRKGKMRRLR